MKITAIHTHYVRIPFDMGAPKQEFAGLRFPTMDHLLVAGGDRCRAHRLGRGLRPLHHPGDEDGARGLRGPVVPRQGCDRHQCSARASRQAFHIFGRNGPVVYAHSAIDIALWDIAGKRAGLPLCDVLGGARRKEVRAYASLMRYGTPKTVGRIAGEMVARGFRHIKLHEHSVDAVRAGTRRGRSGYRPE